MTLIFKKELESIESSVDAFNDSGRARREYRRTPQKRQSSYLVTIFGTAGNSTRDGRN